MTLQIHRLCCWSHSAWMVSLPSIRTDLNGPFFKCRQKGTLAFTAFIHDEVGKFTLSKERKKMRDAAAMCVYVRWWARRPISNIYDVFLRNHSTLKNVHCVHRFIGRHFSLAQGTWNYLLPYQHGRKKYSRGGQRRGSLSLPSQAAAF